MEKRHLVLILVSIFLIGIVSADCCERLDNNGPWCQNAPESECDSNYLSAPTSCESTSFCRLGVCINTNEGTCMPNTPERVCLDAGGIWDERDKEDIPQCQLGCCLIGEQAAFTTLTRCKSLSSIYGLGIDYRTDIQNEVQCIALASPKVKGACVFEEELQRNCKMTTKSECQALEVGDISAEFHEGYLCSAESLQTICGPRGGTSCVEGKDDVFFLDTCGNIANVYDSNRLDDQLYWETIIAPSCGNGVGNADSPTCGDCDYLSGSTCKSAERGNTPRYGNYVCEDLSCEYQGQTYQHGETWCAGGSEDSFPGSRDSRLICYNGEVSVEPCADFRQEVCIQNSIGGFRTSACRVNLWQDCYSQTNERDCTNSDKRDCRWVDGTSVYKDEEGNSLAVDENGELIEASCVPKYSPGFNFWEEETDAKSICPLASTVCYVEYAAGVFEGGLTGEKGIPLDAKCMEKCRLDECLIDDPANICNSKCEKECPSQCVNEDGTLNEDWLENMNGICSSIGDCGSGVNYEGQSGYYNVNDFVVRSSEEQEE